MAEKSHFSNSSVFLASMKQTEGERVVRAIQKLADKINQLENERRLSKRNVETMNVKELSSTKASELFHRLAKAEARCKALQQQLSHIRKIVKDTSSQNFDLSVQHSKSSCLGFSQLADHSVSFESLSSIPALLMDAARVGNSHEIGKKFQAFELDNNQHATIQTSSDDLRSELSSSIIDVPADEPFDSSVRQSRTRTKVKRPQKTSQLEELIGNGFKIKTSDSSECLLNNDRHPSFDLRNHEKFHKEIPGATHKNIQRRRSTSRPRSCEGSPLGMFLQSSRNKDDVLSHFHVKMNEIPFCSATRTGKTHSLGANLQNLMSMVKVCHPALCTAAPLHRRRSRSVERKPCSRFKDHQSVCKKKLSRWNSTSSLDGTVCKCVSPTPETGYPRGLRSGRSRSLERGINSQQTPDALADLDLVPVKLKPTKDKEQSFYHTTKNLCETPGNVCIKTEIKPMPVGSNKVIEVKMTTRAKAKGERTHRSDFEQNRRQLLKNVQELQHMVEKDHCC